MAADQVVEGFREPPRSECVIAPRGPSQNLPLDHYVGALVTARGDTWLLEGVCRHRSVHLAALRALHRGERRVLLVPPDRVHPAPAPRWRRAAGRVAARAIGAAVAARPGIAGAAARSTLVPLAWQFEAAVAFARGACDRLLLADAVGLGKTIQAGYVIAETLATRPGRRVLVLGPAGLLDQWRAELDAHFGMVPVVLDAAALRRLRAWLPPDRDPWPAAGDVCLASIDFVKQPEVLAGAAQHVWDLLVVDEAHALTPGTDRLGAAETLARHARRVLLLTATPHTGSAAAFAALCRVGALDSGPIALLRRTRADLGLPSTRRVRSPVVRSGPAERALHADLVAYARAVWRADTHPGARLAMTVLLKRAASCGGALHRSLVARRAALARRAPLPEDPASQDALPFDDPDLQDDDAALPPELAAPGLANTDEELAWLARLAEHAGRMAGTDGKLARLGRLVRRIREPLIVFTEYRDTLAAALPIVAAAAGGSVAVLHGGVSRRERADAARRFAAGGARVLLATDVASEGLNLHRGSRLVVSLELPWNPLRLEQRIGRVDRFGQGRRVRAITLISGSALESRVLQRIEARLTAIRGALGDVPDTLDVRSLELAAEALELVPEAPAGSHPRQSPPAINSGAEPLADSGIAREAGRLLGEVTAARRLVARRSAPRCPPGGHDASVTRAESPSVARHVPWGVVRWRRGGLAPGVIVALRVPGPLPSEWNVTCVHVKLSRAARTLCRRDLVRACVASAVAHALRATNDAPVSALTAPLVRERALLRHATRPAPAQRPLFAGPEDARDRAQADARELRAREHREEIERLEGCVAPAGASRPTLVTPIAAVLIR